MLIKHLVRTLVFLLFSNLAIANIDPQEILAASDAVRNPEFPFGFINTITEYKNNQQTDVISLAVYSNPDVRTGQYRNLIRYISPARDANKLMLFNGKDVWFYDPLGKASIRLSPQQRLLGQASSGDVATVNLSKDYHAVSATEETILDGEQKSKRSYKLAIVANTSDATYDHIDLWVEVGNSKPVKARFYSDSGRLIKSAYYRNYEKHLGLDWPMQTVIIDGLDPKWVTVMQYSKLLKRDVPESWLQRDYLPRFKPE